MKKYYLYIMLASIFFSGLSTQDAMAKKKKEDPGTCCRFTEKL